MTNEPNNAHTCTDFWAIPPTPRMLKAGHDYHTCNKCGKVVDVVELSGNTGQLPDSAQDAQLRRGYRGGSMPGMNQALGLPHQEKMAKIAICFDVDGTIIDHQGNERERYSKLIPALHKAFKNSKLIVWSGGGAQYAEQRARDLGITQYVDLFMSKLDHQRLRDSGFLILAFDDIQDTALGDLNLIVRQK